MAPGSGLPASPAECRRRAREAPEGRVWGCAMPGTLLLLFAYLTYLALGTGVFWLLESPAAHDSSERFQRDKWALLRNFTCLDGPALDSLIRGIIQAYQNGDIVLDNTTSMGRWEFVGSFFFSVSTITTIGYGNLSPRTMGARLFCIFFALVGIPLNLVVLNRLGHLMQQGVHSCARMLGGTWKRPHWGWALHAPSGPGQGPVAGGLQRPPVWPPAFPAAASAAFLPCGGLELRGGLLLLLHHPQHRGLRRLRDWDEPLPELPSVVQEHSVSVDPLWDGMAGLDHQTDPLPAGGSTRIVSLLLPQL
ncbi:potassium channel subfamily K member 17 isoform X4 [Kogia breviceps]|uniref:potassium channel subfamily K member 17 isoform X4 n=1 Tax=Kogia breviceps TaxID=27615 RepID=UPI0034D26E75